MGRSPRQKGGVERGDATRGGVQEIPEHDEAPGVCAREQRREPREIGPRAAARQSDAARAERGGLAQMHVRDEQRLAGRPVERAIRLQLDALAGERRRPRGRGAWCHGGRGNGGGWVAGDGHGVAGA